MHWPAGISASGEWRRSPGHLIDIMATCVGVGQTTYPEEFQGSTIRPAEGVSLVSAFENDTLEREAIYFEHEGNRAVRKGPWKLVAQGREGPWELYNMKQDRTELNNVADEHPERVQKLVTLWQAWAERAQVIPWPN